MSAFAASAAAVGVRPPSRARAVSSRAPVRAYGMASFSGLKAAPAEPAIAGRRVATFADKVTASLRGAGNGRGEPTGGRRHGDGFWERQQQKGRGQGGEEAGRVDAAEGGEPCRA